jgi:hypothetical protein
MMAVVSMPQMRLFSGRPLSGITCRVRSASTSCWGGFYFDVETSSKHRRSLLGRSTAPVRCTCLLVSTLAYTWLNDNIVQ